MCHRQHQEQTEHFSMSTLSDHELHAQPTNTIGWSVLTPGTCVGEHGFAHS